MKRDTDPGPIVAAAILSIVYAINLAGFHLSMWEIVKIIFNVK